MTASSPYTGHNNVTPRRSPRDIAHDATLSNARKIELLKMLMHHNAAPWQMAVMQEADAELSRLLRTQGSVNRH